MISAEVVHTKAKAAPWYGRLNSSTHCRPPADIQTTLYSASLIAVLGRIL